MGLLDRLLEIVDLFTFHRNAIFSPKFIAFTFYFLCWERDFNFLLRILSMKFYWPLG